jgi:hypothetical protein
MKPNIVFNYTMTSLIIILNIMPSFNRLDIFWMVYTLLFIDKIKSVKEEYRLPIITTALLCKTTRIMLVSMLFIPIVFMGGYDYFRLTSFHIFKTCLDTQFLGYSKPTTPTIYVANYPANLIEYKLFPLLADKICIVIFSGTKISHFLNNVFGADRIIFVTKGGEFERVQKRIQQKINDGYTVFAYVEKEYFKRKNAYSISRLSTGMFNIAHNIGATVTPLVCDHIEHVAGIMTSRRFRVYIGETKEVTVPSETVKDVTKLFQRTLRKFSIK